MDVPSSMNVEHGDNWETNDNFIIPSVQEQETVSKDGLIKSSVDIVLSHTVSTMEGNISTQESVTVVEHHGNGMEPSYELSDTHGQVASSGYISTTGKQLEDSFMMDHYCPVENIPLPPEIGMPPSVSISVDKGNAGLSQEPAVGSELYVGDPGMVLSQEHLTVFDKEVASSIELSQGPVYIDSSAIPKTERVEYLPLGEQPKVEHTAQYQESDASVEADSSRLIIEEANMVPTTQVTSGPTHEQENIVESIDLPVQENAISELSVQIGSILYKDEANEITPIPLYESFETLESGIDNETDSISLPVTVNNNSVDTVIDLVLPLVDAASVTMPDPVSLRPNKPVKERPVKVAAKDGPDSSTVIPKTVSAVTKGRILQTPSTVVETSGQKLSRSTVSKGPPVKITSQFVSKDELAKELQERSKRNFPNINVPGGDILFSKTMTKRLASNLQAGSSKVQQEIKEMKALKNVQAKKLTVETAVKPTTEPAVKLPAEPALVPTIKDTVSSSGDDDLLAILEGDVDDWSIDQPPPQLVEAARSPISLPLRNDPPKLDPAIERELALKQLNAMPSARRYRKSAAGGNSKMQMSRKSKLQPKKELDVKVPAVKIASAVGKVADTEKPLRKRKIVEGAAEPDESSRIESNGESIVVNEAVAGGPEVVKAPRIFKTKKSLKLTNGAVVTMKKTATVAANNKPNKSNDKPAKSVKKSKSENETDSAGAVPPSAAAATRTLVSPPRTYSSRIKKSTYSDDFVFPSTSKSRVVPIVGVARESKTTKNPKVDTIKVEPMDDDTPVEVTPVVKRPRGRPPKSKVTKDNSPPSTDAVAPPKPVQTVKTKTTPASAAGRSAKKPGKTEIDRLLQDEGAVNMLYAVEQDEETRRTGAPSAKTRHSHRDLLKRTQLVKSAVQRLKNTSPSVSLRHKRASQVPTTPQRKTSFDSATSLQSPPALTPVEPSSPTMQIFTYPPRLRPPAEASRIIRRHSSSSNFSSRSTSPNPSRRLSGDAMSPLSNHDVDHVTPTSSAAKVESTRKRGSTQIYIRKSDVTGKGIKKKCNADGSLNTSVEDSIFKPRECTVVIDNSLQTNKTLLEDAAKSLQKGGGGRKEVAADRVKKTPSTDSSRSGGRQRKGAADGGPAPDLTTCLAEAVTAFIAEDGNLDSSSLPPELPKETCSTSPSLTFASISYASVLRTLEADVQRRTEELARERTSPRTLANLTHYKELSVCRHDNLVQVVIAPVSTKLMNSHNPQVWREVRDVLTSLRKDDSCHAVLITSTGSSFCLGVDFHSLVVEKADRRKAVALEFATALKQFVTSLAHFNKPIIAGVHGAAVGLGVTMLPFFDMVFASDKATFYTPYARLGQAPEGAAVVTMPLLLGNAVTSELLYACRKLTATEALHYGLVTRILWPDKFQEELLSLSKTFSNQSAQSMEATKALLRFNLRGRVDAVLEAESSLLVQHWTSNECQTNFKRFLDDEDVGLQRQRNDA